MYGLRGVNSHGIKRLGIKPAPITHRRRFWTAMTLLFLVAVLVWSVIPETIEGTEDIEIEVVEG